MRLAKKILLYFLISVVTLITLGAIIVYVYEDDIKKYAVEHINKYLKSEVKVEQIELSLIDKFPSASLNFHNVYIKDPISSDTLIFAKDMYLEFDIFDILSGEYTINKVDIEVCKFFLSVNQSGEENYRFWKEGSDSASVGSFSFALDKVNIKDALITYRNSITQQDYSFFADEIKLSGNFSETNYTLKTSSNLIVNKFKSKNITIIKNKHAALAINLLIDNKEKSYTFQNGKMQIEDLNFNVGGVLNYNDDGMQCDIKVDGQEIAITSIFSSFSKTLFESIQNYESRGNMKFDATIAGMVSNTKLPVINADFSISDGFVREKTNNIDLKKVRLDGHFTNNADGKKEKLTLNNIKAIFKDGTFSGNVMISDFKTPDLIIDVSGDLNLKTVHEFLKIESIEHLKGRSHFDAFFDGFLPDPQNINAENLKIRSLTGSVNFDNTTLKLSDYHHLYDNVSGTFVLNNNDAAVKDLNVLLGQSDFQFNGGCKNFITFLLFPDQKLNVIASLESTNFKLADLMIPDSSSSGDSNHASKFNFPDNINFNIDGNIGKFSYDKFIAENTSCRLTLIDKQLTTKLYSLNTANGAIDGQFKVDGASDERFIVSAEINAESLNVKMLFNQFKNFGQTMITDEKIKGDLTAQTKFAAVLDKHLNFDQDKIYCFSNISIVNGELIGLETMKAITDYMREGKAIKLILKNHINDLENRLSHIRFSKIENQIEIQNKKVYIPDMQIRSSAMNIGLSGTHTFDNAINYNFNFNFRDLKKSSSYTEFGREIDDDLGLKIFLTMRGTIDEPIFEWDKKNQQEARKEKMLEEKQTFKAALKQEFGAFKKNTTVKVTPTPKEEVEFILYGGELDEENSPEKQLQKQEEQPNKKKANTFFNKLNIQKEDTKKEEFEFEEEDF